MKFLLKISANSILKSKFLTLESLVLNFLISNNSFSVKGNLKKYLLKSWSNCKVSNLLSWNLMNSKMNF